MFCLNKVYLFEMSSSNRVYISVTMPICTINSNVAISQLLMCFSSNELSDGVMHFV